MIHLPTLCLHPLERDVCMHALDLNTGLGDCRGKLVITVDGVGTFEGSEHGTHTTIGDYWGVSGKVVADGTCWFIGLKLMGSYEGEITTDLLGNLVVEVATEGIILSPTG